MIEVPRLTLPLTTACLVLRDYRPEDVPAVLAYVAVEDYWRDQAVEMPSREQIAALVQWAAHESRVMPRLNYYLAATLKDGGEVVGEAVLRLVNPAMGQAEIGFGIAARFRGQGYATEIGRALLAAAFGSLNVHRVGASCAPENAGSIAVLAKLGFVRDGLLRDVAFARGRWWGSLIYSVLETEAR